MFSLADDRNVGGQLIQIDATCFVDIFDVMIVVNTNVVFDWFRRFNTVGSAAKGVTYLKVF